MKRSKLVSCPSKQIRLGMLMRSNPAHMRHGNFAVPLTGTSKPTNTDNLGP
jgi:hypothetical protein